MSKIGHTWVEVEISDIEKGIYHEIKI